MNTYKFFPNFREKFEKSFRKFCTNRKIFIKIMKNWPQIVIFIDFLKMENFSCVRPPTRRPRPRLWLCPKNPPRPRTVSSHASPPEPHRRIEFSFIPIFLSKSMQILKSDYFLIFHYRFRQISLKNSSFGGSDPPNPQL